MSAAQFTNRLKTVSAYRYAARVHVGAGNSSTSFHVVSKLDPSNRPACGWICFSSLCARSAMEVRYMQVVFGSSEEEDSWDMGQVFDSRHAAERVKLVLE